MSSQPLDSRHGATLLGPTVIYQIWVGGAPPTWVEHCVTRTREWAESRGYEYRLFGDEMYDLVPREFQENVGNRICPITDYARLKIAKAFLGEGYGRTVWIDADLLIFNKQFDVPSDAEFAFCREVWLQGRKRVKRHQFYILEKVANSITVFTPRTQFLDFYIEACSTLAERAKGKADNLVVGTTFLERFHRAYPFRLIHNVGILSPYLIRELYYGKSNGVRAYMQRIGNPIYAANLTGSAKGETFLGLRIDDKVFAHVMETLEMTGGEVLNRWVP